ncbi:hypothetical protein ACLOJK_035601 [Asimina triloba]
MDMEPICGQAFGAKRWSLLALILQRTLVILFISCLPLTLLWLAMEKFLRWCGQDPKVMPVASIYITLSIPDLFAQAIFHPLHCEHRMSARLFTDPSIQPTIRHLWSSRRSLPFQINAA